MTKPKSLWHCLRHPRRTLQWLDQSSSGTPPIVIWIALISVAVVGSVIYGASLSLVLPDWKAANAALWLALSAGLAWCVFIPALVLVTKRRLIPSVHACLVTMAYGEAVLVTGSLLNVAIRLTPLTVDPVTMNCAIVAASNVVMAAALGSQLQILRTPIWQVLIVWFVVLDGGGVFFFWSMHHLLHDTP